MQAAVHTKRYAGNVTAAWPLWGELPPSSKGSTAAQLLGLRYEGKALRYLEEYFKFFIPQLGFKYSNVDQRIYRCWVDACIFSSDFSRLTVVEIKWHHTADAWVQMRELYVPVMRVAFPDMLVQQLEVCKFYNPAVRLPGRVKIVASAQELEAVIEGREHSEYSILAWTGR